MAINLLPQSDTVPVDPNTKQTRFSSTTAQLPNTTETRKQNTVRRSELFRGILTHLMRHALSNIFSPVRRTRSAAILKGISGAASSLKRV